MTKRKSTAVATLRPPRRKASSRQQSAAPLDGKAALYSVHPAVIRLQKWIAELKSHTGRSLEQWLAFIAEEGPVSQRACRAWLQQRHGLNADSAWWLAQRAAGNQPDAAADSPDVYLRACPTYVAALYSGPRGVLRPIHDQLVRLARDLGADVRVCPCKSVVPLFRRHVFAEIKPATSKRLDLGLALGDEPFTSRLLDTGGRLRKSRITHRVSLATLDDIDLQVRRWLKEAYQRDTS
jgi:hypothetical protein